MKLGRLAILALLAAGIAVANASVFVFLPVQVSVNPTQPPVIFVSGSNAGQPDLSGTIDVSVGANASSLVLTVHPTYQTTYYYNISLVKNNSTTTTYYIKFNVQTPLSLPSGSQAYLVVAAPNGSIYKIDLIAGGVQPNGWIALSAGDTLRLDLEFIIPEGVQLPSSASAQVGLVYSSVQESTIPTP